MKAIINANVVLENGILWDGVILIDGNKITEVKSMREAEIPENAEIIDAAGSYVGPGFIDIHVHGSGGFSDSFETEKAAEYFLKHGTTSFLATPSGREDLLEAIRSVKKVKDKIPQLKGMYVEGPYLNSKYGANAKGKPWAETVDEDFYKPLLDETGDLVKVWMVAPEREGIIGFVEYARKINPDVLFAVGHSEATPEQIKALGKYRPKVLTHVFDATGRQPVPGGTRGYGPDEYCFLEPDMYAELICDSCAVHVNPDLQRLVLKNKGVNRVILITDCTIYKNPPPEHLSYVTDLNFNQNGGIAGSKLSMDVACRNIMTHTNSSIAQSFIMASTNPARLLGLDEEIGTVEAGKIADLVFVDDKFNVQKVILGGKVCEF